MSDRQTRSATRRKAAALSSSQKSDTQKGVSKRSQRGSALVNDNLPPSSPISTLPTETLCHIFLLAQDMTRAEDTPENPLVEVVVSHVCKRWRDVAISFPNLWTYFRYKRSIRRIPRDRLAAYLKRSYPLLLDLTFDCGDLGLPFPAKKARQHIPFLSSTIPHANRWRRVAFLSDEGFSIEQLCKQLTSLEAPHLESLVLRPDNDDDDDSEMNQDYHDGAGYDLGPRILTGGAPKLNYVLIDSPKHLPPLSNVTVLRLEDNNPWRDVWVGLKWEDFKQVLKLPSLTSLSVCGIHLLEPPIQDDQEILKADKLKHLRIGEDEEFGMHFLSHLSAPGLETLVLMDIEEMDDGIHPSQPSPIFPALRVLGLINVIVETDAEVDFLTAMAPKVQHLIVSHDPAESTALVHRLWETSTWPQLREVTSNVLNEKSSIKPFVDFASARKGFGLPLHTFRMSSDLVSSWRKSKVLKQLEKHCKVIEPFTGQFDRETWPPEISL